MRSNRIVKRSDNAELALLAWKLLGTLAAAAVVFAVAASIPELTRYLKLKSM